MSAEKLSLSWNEDLEEFLGVGKDCEIKGLSNHKNVQNKQCDDEMELKMQNAVDVRFPNKAEQFLDEFLEETENKFHEDEHHQIESSETDIDVKPFNQEESNDTLGLSSTLKDEAFGLSSAVRDGAGNYRCTKCDYTATNSSRLKQHIYSIHEGVRYPCLICEYKATQKSSLNRHMKRHTSN